MQLFACPFITLIKHKFACLPTRIASVASVGINKFPLFGFAKIEVGAKSWPKYVEILVPQASQQRLLTVWSPSESWSRCMV